MKSRLVLNLVLLVLILGLAVVSYFEPGKKKEEQAPLTVVDEKNLHTITLQNKDLITFGKQEGHWRLSAPFKAPANEIRVQQLMDIAKAKIEAQYPVKSEDLAKFELDKPKASITLNGSTLHFGGADPINMRRYVRVENTLFLVTDNFFHHLTASATDYVDKKLLPENAKIREISIPGLKAILGPDGKWTQEPKTEPAANLNDLVNAWSNARAIDVKRLEKPAQGEPIKIDLLEGQPIEWVIVQKEPDLKLARQDLGFEYELTGEFARQLLNMPKLEPKQENQPTNPADGEKTDAPREEDSPAEEELEEEE